MPIIQGIRKHPLDSNKNVRIGVAFPLDEVNLFSTVKGQKVNMPQVVIKTIEFDPHYNKKLKVLEGPKVVKTFK